MTGRSLIYGATGYTGKLVARMAKEADLKPILAGRNEDKLKLVANRNECDYCVIDLNDRRRLETTLTGVDVVLHLAGPFSQTSRQMVDACIKTQTHYLDITGEIDVFEACAKRDAEAKEQGIMMMPGVGFDVVPSDCLAAHLKRRMPAATKLALAITGMGKMSRGTAKTGVESIGKGTRIRRDGRIISASKPLLRDIDFGQGPTSTIAAAWGDVASAYYSTGVPNITVYFEAKPQLVKVLKLGALMRFVLSTGIMQSILKRRIDQRPEGPTDEQRAAGFSIIVGEAENDKGETVVTRLRTPDGYTLTYMTCLDILRRVLAGEAKSGFQTPSMVFGPDFITDFENCEFEDIVA